MSLIFINRFYWPEEPATSQLLTDMAEGLAGCGNEVRIITSRPFEIEVPSKETHNSVSIIRVGSSRYGSSNLTGRVIDFLSFIIGTSWQLLTKTKAKDTVVFLTDPPFLAAALWPLLSLRKVRFIHWVQDIYPEIAITLTGHRWLSILKPWRNLSWRRAHKCVTLGRDMAAVIRQAGVTPENLKIIPNWAPAGLYASADTAPVTQLKSQWNLTGKFVALYSGNLGRVHDLTPIIEVASLLIDEKNIAIVFVGHGAQLESLQQTALARGLSNIHFKPPQPRESLNTTLALGDVHFVTLREGCESYVYPSKLYGIMAVARPVIFIGPSKCDLSLTIQNNQLGLSNSSHDISGIVGAIRVLSGDSSMRQQYAQQTSDFARAHSLENAIHTWDQLLTDQSTLADR
jgi:colanic acid biosynthesis glycosyl transferase WcaI